VQCGKSQFRLNYEFALETQVILSYSEAFYSELVFEFLTRCVLGIEGSDVRGSILNVGLCLHFILVFILVFVLNWSPYWWGGDDGLLLSLLVLKGLDGGES
jgi:hypothetical protein